MFRRQLLDGPELLEFLKVDHIGSLDGKDDAAACIDLGTSNF